LNSDSASAGPDVTPSNMMNSISYDIASQAGSMLDPRFIRPSLAALAHDVHGGRLDHIRDALLIARAERILVLVQVLLRKAVDMRVGVLLIFADNRTADSDVAIGIVGIDDRQRYFRTDLHIVRLHSAARRVDANLAVGVVEPDRGHLRRAVGHYGRDIRQRFLGGKEVEKLLGNGARGHRWCSFE